MVFISKKTGFTEGKVVYETNNVDSSNKRDACWDNSSLNRSLTSLGEIPAVVFECSSVAPFRSLTAGSEMACTILRISDHFSHFLLKSSLLAKSIFYSFYSFEFGGKSHSKSP